MPGLTLLLASWMPWQDLAKFLLHLGNHGFHCKIITIILPRMYHYPTDGSNLTKIEKILRFKISIKSSKNGHIRLVILLPGLHAITQPRPLFAVKIQILWIKIEEIIVFRGNFRSYFNVYLISKF